MTQDEINRKTVDVLAGLLEEVWRSTRSDQWDRLPSLRVEVKLLKEALSK